MELISQLFCLKGKIKKKFLMTTHVKRQQLFDVMVFFLPRSRLLFETLHPAS